MAGDKGENSQDSRYWGGLLPEEYIVGKATFIWKSVDPYTGKYRWERFLKLYTNRQRMNTKLFIFLTILLSACSSYQDKRLEYALALAEENRQELEKVLKYYQNSPKKLAAAHFLIQNMPYYYEYDSQQLDTVKTIIKDALKEKRAPWIKSLIISDQKVKMNQDIFYTLRKKYDIQTITADYLINNIDLAFKVWKEQPWNKNLCFEDFCELILPYRIANEKLSDWRNTYYNKYVPLLDSLYKGNDVIEACNTLVRILKKEGFYYNAQFKIPHLDALFLMENRAGYCKETCDISLYAMRAVGIPVATDQMVYSPEYQGGHSWNVVRDTTGQFIPFLYTDYEASRDMKDDGRKKGKSLEIVLAYKKQTSCLKGYSCNT